MKIFEIEIDAYVPTEKQIYVPSDSDIGFSLNIKGKVNIVPTGVFDENGDIYEPEGYLDTFETIPYYKWHSLPENECEKFHVEYTVPSDPSGREQVSMDVYINVNCVKSGFSYVNKGNLEAGNNVVIQDGKINIETDSVAQKGSTKPIQSGAIDKIVNDSKVVLGKNAFVPMRTKNAVAIGIFSKAHNHSTAVGENTSSGDYGTAIGYDAVAGTIEGYDELTEEPVSAISDTANTAIGNNAVADGNFSTAIGGQSEAHYGATAVGFAAVAVAGEAVLAGGGTNPDTGKQTLNEVRVKNNIKVLFDGNKNDFSFPASIEKEGFTDKMAFSITYHGSPLKVEPESFYEFDDYGNFTPARFNVDYQLNNNQEFGEPKFAEFNQPQQTIWEGYVTNVAPEPIIITFPGGFIDMKTWKGNETSWTIPVDKSVKLTWIDGGYYGILNLWL